MRMARDIAMVAVGAGAVLAYQKYQKPMMKQMDKMRKSMSETLDDMM
jgi:hypothetical protein